MSFNIRMTVPVTGAVSPFTIPGTTRRYACASGSTIDVNEDDARILKNIGWIATLPVNAKVGPTSGRAATAKLGELYIDTTLSIVVVCDGKGNWLNSVSGAVS